MNTRALPLVFLGPSLPRRDAARICAAEYRPPISRGDLARLAGPVPRRIGIVDGRFYQSLAVSPGEILEGISAGHRFYGAASMGALRAVELAHVGMAGVGRIYEEFASGRVERDDEVAVIFDAETGSALSVPLIAMRLAFREATDRGLLSEAEGRRAVEAAEALYYPQRTYARAVAELCLPRERGGNLLRFLESEATDLKADDTRELLRRIAEDERGEGLSKDARPGSHLRPLTTLRPGLRLGPERPRLGNLPPAPKVPGWSSVRTVPAAVTDGILRGIRGRFGVTRVAEVTQLDRLGIPCFTAVAPGLDIAVYSGKSLDPREARVGAQMEALEAALLRDRREPIRRARHSHLSREFRALDPEGLQVIGSERRDLREVEFDWVPGWDLRTGEEVWVPADAVFVSEDPPPWFFSSNGVAAGNCLVEAISHALAELIERDAETHRLLATDYAHVPNIPRLLAGSPRGPQPARLPPVPAVDYPFVDLETLPEPLRDAVHGIRAAGVAVDLRWISSDIAVPVFLCLLHERGDGSASLTHSGSGAHPDAVVAARRAITEAAQSRATYIQGVREDLRVPSLWAQDPPADPWLRPRTDSALFSRFPTHVHENATEDVRYMMDALDRVGLLDVVVVDLSHVDIPFAVVRVIVPGIEAPLALEDRGRVPLGWRARRLLERAAVNAP